MQGESLLDCAVTPKEQAEANLSGKKTLAGRTSGERLPLRAGHPRSKCLSYKVNMQLSGSKDRDFVL